ncbi:MAG: cytochrome-c peroxidase [Flavobacteriaceae bacterium]
MIKSWTYFFFAAILFISCSDQPEDNYIPVGDLSGLNLPETPYNYADIELPDHLLNNSFPNNLPFQQAAINQDNSPADNQTTDAGATLGRVLFFDKKLSANSSISCASCHQPEHGFSDPEILSVGFEGGLTRRHSMGLANARFYANGRFFWDERALSLEDQVLMPFQDEVEMGLSLDQLVDIVNQQEYYPILFYEAFGDENINSDRISKALAQFVRSMVSTTSKYDFARNEVDNPMQDFPGFTAEENLGKRLFYGPIVNDNGDRVNCAGCHVSEAFLVPAPGALTNGLDAQSTDDLGIFESSGNPNDIGEFKSPSLKNIGIRPPYMHDGRFASLEEVIEFYNSGIQNHQNLRPPLRNPNGQAIVLNLDQEEKDALVAFLHTLTDYEMMEDPKFSDPFIE